MLLETRKVMSSVLLQTEPSTQLSLDSHESRTEPYVPKKSMIGLRGSRDSSVAKDKRRRLGPYNKEKGMSWLTPEEGRRTERLVQVILRWTEERAVVCAHSRWCRYGAPGSWRKRCVGCGRVL